MMQLIQRMVLIVGLLVVGLGLLPGSVLADASPYTPQEFAIITDTTATPVPEGIYGDWVVYQWVDYGGAHGYGGRNLSTGESFEADDQGALSGTHAITIYGDHVAWIQGYQPSQIELLTLSTGERQTLVERPGGIRAVALSEDLLVWLEMDTTGLSSEIRARRLSDGSEFSVASGPEQRANLCLGDDVIVWDQAPSLGASRDILGYRVSDGQSLTIAGDSWDQHSPAIWGNLVVWEDVRSGDSSESDIYGRDLSSGDLITITTAPGAQRAPSVWGQLVVWEDGRDSSDLSGVDIYGYDLAQGSEFAVTRHLGRQGPVVIHDHTVVWEDWRNVPQIKYSTGELYGAQLLDQPLSEPLPVTGAPDAFDGVIEVVWPHSGQPGTDTDQANIGVYLFTPPDTLQAVPCAFDPPLELWVALDNQPARPAKVVRQRSWNWSPAIWHFNDVDVSAARDPNHRLYLFLKTSVDAVFRTNVWAHAADARTYYPNPTPVGAVLSQVPSSVDAVIQIVWPHNGAPVSQASLANITINLFGYGSSASVPANWQPRVLLYASLNNEVGQIVAIGTRRLVSQGGLTYPVWDFNNIDVSAARDPLNKIYFRIEVEGVPTYSSVWVHGADARSYVPQPDVYTCSCNTCP